MTSKEKILEEAFSHFSSKGIVSTKIDDIATGARVSKKTIYSLFSTKNELIEEACRWKLNVISVRAQQIVDLDIGLIEKFVKYLEIVVTDVTDISTKMSVEVLDNKDRVMGVVNDYLKGAVFTRFSALIAQGIKEKWINPETDASANLIIYWETLSSFLFGRAGRHVPHEFQLEKPFFRLFGDQLINFFRGLLNESGIREFDQQLKKHEKLSGLFG